MNPTLTAFFKDWHDKKLAGKHYNVIMLTGWYTTRALYSTVRDKMFGIFTFLHPRKYTMIFEIAPKAHKLFPIFEI